MFGTQAHKAALDTDHAWQVELEKAFGKRAGNMRYVKAGEGESGTALRAAYEARTAAQAAWEVEIRAEYAKRIAARQR